MTVVGDFDEKEIAALTQELFGNWKSPNGYTRIKSEYRAIEPINKSIETPDKANAFFLARMNVKMRDDNADYPALVLGNYMLGGGFLSSRLAVRIRQKEGLSYGVGSNFSASSLDETGSFLANAIYAPENAEKLEAAFKDELAKLSKGRVYGGGNRSCEKRLAAKQTTFTRPGPRTFRPVEQLFVFKSHDWLGCRF